MSVLSSLFSGPSVLGVVELAGASTEAQTRKIECFFFSQNSSSRYGFLTSAAMEDRSSFLNNAMKSSQRGSTSEVKKLLETKLTEKHDALAAQATTYVEWQKFISDCEPLEGILGGLDLCALRANARNIHGRECILALNGAMEEIEGQENTILTPACCSTVLQAWASLEPSLLGDLQPEAVAQVRQGSVSLLEHLKAVVAAPASTPPEKLVTAGLADVILGFEQVPTPCSPCSRESEPLAKPLFSYSSQECGLQASCLAFSAQKSRCLSVVLNFWRVLVFCTPQEVMGKSASALKAREARWHLRVSSCAWWLLRGLRRVSLSTHVCLL